MLLLWEILADLVCDGGPLLLKRHGEIFAFVAWLSTWKHPHLPNCGYHFSLGIPDTTVHNEVPNVRCPTSLHYLL